MVSFLNIKFLFVKNGPVSIMILIAPSFIKVLNTVNSFMHNVDKWPYFKSLALATPFVNVMHGRVELEMTTRLLSKRHTRRKDAEYKFLYFLCFFQGVIW